MAAQAAVSKVPQLVVAPRRHAASRRLLLVTVGLPRRDIATSDSGTMTLGPPPGG
jgi:hypothetical protein